MPKLRFDTEFVERLHVSQISTRSGLALIEKLVDFVFERVQLVCQPFPVHKSPRRYRWSAVPPKTLLEVVYLDNHAIHGVGHVDHGRLSEAPQITNNGCQQCFAVPHGHVKTYSGTRNGQDRMNLFHLRLLTVQPANGYDQQSLAETAKSLPQVLGGKQKTPLLRSVFTGKGGYSLLVSACPSTTRFTSENVRRDLTYVDLPSLANFVTEYPMDLWAKRKFNGQTPDFRQSRRYLWSTSRYPPNMADRDIPNDSLGYVEPEQEPDPDADLEPVKPEHEGGAHPNS